ncbi:hypothetical protein NC981_19215 [Leptolyngbya sp. DQ-M1]|uniref:hypothetical protein n=1 Tax=Leptolyngbya sp. DQ-M1 TaxID=2933920 RepID=UPI00329A5158
MSEKIVELIVASQPLKAQVRAKQYPLSLAPRALYDLLWTPQRSLRQDLLIALAEALAFQQKGGVL